MGRRVNGVLREKNMGIPNVFLGDAAAFEGAYEY